ncbi:MAG: putative Ig domain-containing protein, partial [Dehalococcoidia bacterium]
TLTPTASDGAGAPYTWSTVNKPFWLSLDANTGIMTGTPGVSAVTVTFTLQVKDKSGNKATKDLTIVMNPVPLPAISAATPTTATIGKPYTLTPTASGGTAPYTWSTVNKPSWLSLNANTGVLSGTPGVPAATVTFTLKAKDSVGASASKDINIIITASPATFTINENPSPVFSTLIPDQAYVIKDNVNYKLYYAGNDFASINLAQSPDGITWTPYSGNPIIWDAQYHADVKYYSTGFPGANSGSNPSAVTMNYRMWYQGLNGNSIGGWRYAESPNGINWYNHIAVTQFGPPVYSALTGVDYGIADVIYTPGASNTGTDWTFRIYANVQWEGGLYGGKELVVMAFSTNGYNWTGYDPTSVGYATPVFAGTLDPTQFDCDHIGWFKVIKNSATDWKAFYSGGKGTTYQALNGIGYATSTDGINWTRKQTLFTSSDGVPWRSQSVWMPSVVQTGSSYQIYFLGSNNPDMGNSDWIQWKVGRAILTP